MTQPAYYKVSMEITGRIPLSVNLEDVVPARVITINYGRLGRLNVS